MNGRVTAGADGGKTRKISINKVVHLSEVRVRLAQPRDREEVRRLIENGEMRFARVPLGDLDSILSSRLVLVATERRHVKGALVSIWPHPPFAWLDVLAVEPKSIADEVLDSLLDAFEDYLALGGVRKALCSMEDGDSRLIREKLLGRRFRLTARFLRYEKTDFSVPPFDAPRVTLRPAMKRDLPEVGRIEKVCFEPLWRNDEAMLKRLMSRCDNFIVALAGRAVVGFQYSAVDKAMVGQLTRLAVDPMILGTNVAKKLTADAIEFFRSETAERVEVRTAQTNVAAQRLFSSFGFRDTGAYRDVFAKDIMQENCGDVARGRIGH